MSAAEKARAELREFLPFAKKRAEVVAAWMARGASPDTLRAAVILLSNDARAIALMGGVADHA